MRNGGYEETALQCAAGATGWRTYGGTATTPCAHRHIESIRCCEHMVRSAKPAIVLLSHTVVWGLVGTTKLINHNGVASIGSCTHLDQIRDVTPSAEGCEECLQMGDTWVPFQRVYELRPRGLL